MSHKYVETKQPRVIFIEYKSDVIIDIIFISPGSKGLIKGKFQAVMFKQTVWYFSNVSVLSPEHVLFGSCCVDFQIKISEKQPKNPMQIW